MSNLDNLTQKILEDAKNKASEIVKGAEKRNDSLINQRVKEANERKEKILEKAAAEAEMLKDRVISSAELKVRDEKLSAKQEVMDTVFKMAKDKLSDLDQKEYLRFVESSIKDIDIEGKPSVLVKKEKVQQLKELSDEVALVEDESVDSGFILKDGDIIYNYTFDALVDEIREDLEGEIVQKLFEE
ncbi:V-type ATP synthase subunit E [Gudongella sp. DL1XJH-153]|uniref:V-type ATP synthase subunit E n=1 Tax=Gudongella sp. DL1XJH-153 TaxID=3409804 RepID=UPI003BB768C2